MNACRLLLLLEVVEVSTVAAGDAKWISLVSTCVQVLMRQRELGLAQLAGTADMPIDGVPSLPSGAASGRGRFCCL